MYQLSLATLSEINPISEVPLHQDAIYLCVKSDANVLSVIELQITLKTFIYITTIFGTSVPLFMLVSVNSRNRVYQCCKFHSNPFKLFRVKECATFLLESIVKIARYCIANNKT